MRIMLLLQVMFRMRLLTPGGIWRLLTAIQRHGVNIMALLRLAERTYGDSPAIVDERETATYRQLLSESRQLSAMLRQRFMLAPGMKVGLVGRNRLTLVRSVFAISSTGADLFLLNAELSGNQIHDLAADYGLHLLLYDDELEQLADFAACPTFKLGDWTKIIQDEGPWAAEVATLRPRTSSGRIMLLTGGTTGKSKGVPHRPSLLHYLPPLAALLTKLPLTRCRTVYIATPMAHGYGIANLLMFVALGYKIVLTPRFEAAAACRLIREQRVEVAIVVPLMIHRMLLHDSEALQSLRCIASGGAALSPKLAAETMHRLGDVLYNLYGTTEGGLTTIATPHDLRDAAGTIGRVIPGVPLQVLDEAGRKAGPGVVGRLCIRSQRAPLRETDAAEWIETGDMGCREASGLYRLCGRVDDMIVSGGENVYPAEVEQVIIGHPLVEDAAVVGVEDELFGQRLVAFVQPVRRSELTEATLKMWLKPLVARYQFPMAIVFLEELPYTPVGKLNRKALKASVL